MASSSTHRRGSLHAALPALVALAFGCFLVLHAQPGGSNSERLKSKKDDSEMILIPAGPFTYGITQREVRQIIVSLRASMAEIYSTELSKSNKNLDSFYIGKYEITNEQYARFVQETKHREPRYSRYPQLNGRRQPVVGVGWGDAESYCSWAGMRLPSEVECTIQINRLTRQIRLWP